jgi:hypothetical protein
MLHKMSILRKISSHLSLFHRYTLPFPTEIKKHVMEINRQEKTSPQHPFPFFYWGGKLDFGVDY